MMSEGEVRYLLQTLKNNANQKDLSPIVVMTFSGGVSALEMVLEETSANPLPGVPA